MSKHIVIDARIRRASTGRPVARLIEHLANTDTGYRYTILVQPDDPWQPQVDYMTRVDCPYPQYSFNPLQQLTFGWQIRRLKPDLVHFTLSGQQPLGYFGKQITFTHDLTMYEYVRAGKLPSWLHALRMRGYRLLMWAAHRKAVKIHVPTKYVRDGLAKLHPFTADKLVVTYESGDPPLDLSPAALPYLQNKEFVLCVGTAFPHKNLPGVVEAFLKLYADNPSLHLVMAGKHEYHYAQLIKWIDEVAGDARKNIHLPGFVSDEELVWLYKNAGVYVFASFSEGFGLPGLEAMAQGCPVVSSNATCLPEVHGDAAHYFDPNNTDEMAERINDVLTDEKLREKLVKTGFSQLKKFSWEKMTREIVDIYDEVLQ